MNPAPSNLPVVIGFPNTLDGWVARPPSLCGFCLGLPSCAAFRRTPTNAQQWMSGQAEALVARRIDDSSLIQRTTVPFRDAITPRERRPPSLLDFYLSWMSPC